jgi:hypothetical protein
MPAAIKIDADKLRSFMRLKPSLEHTASFFNCNESTIVRFIKSNFEQSFFEFRDRQMNNTRHALVQKALSEAMGANELKDDDGKVISKGKPVNTALMIFSLKNLAGWSDVQDVTHTVKEDNLLFIDEDDPDGNELATPVKNASKAD